MEKKILLLIFGLFLISVVSATNIGTFKQGQQMQITNFCNIGDCSYANLTTIALPNGTINYINLVMTKNGQNFNYSYVPKDLGTYNFNTCSNPNGIKICDSDSFTITPSGKSFNIQQSLLTYLSFFGILLLFGLCVFFAMKFSGGNIRSEDGGLIGINYKKYFGYTLWILSYAFFNWILNFLISISSFLSINTFSGLFTFLFDIVTKNALIAFFIYAIIVIYNIIKDSKLNEILKSTSVYYG